MATLCDCAPISVTKAMAINATATITSSSVKPEIP
jgi:hypothetical protein